MRLRKIKIKKRTKELLVQAAFYFAMAAMAMTITTLLWIWVIRMVLFMSAGATVELITTEAA